MPVGFTEDGEKTWLQELHRRLKDAEAAIANVMAHNLDSQTDVFELQDTIERALVQTRLICQKKGVVI